MSSSILLPKHWNGNDKCKYLVLDDAKLRVSYKGVGKFDTDAGAIRADRAIPPACGLYYFEIFITSKGRDGHIGIGLCAPATSLTRLPGWDEHTFGYHADDGNIFKGSGGIEYGPTFTSGDTIGCCVNFRTNSVFYTKNGLRLGLAFQGILNEPLFPAVGLRTPGEIVEANFGQKPFVFDYPKFVEQEKRAIISDAMRVPRRGLDAELPKMILQYLIHYGYTKTATSFASSILPSFTTDTNFTSINERQLIMGFILDGQIDKATENIKKFYPVCLQSRKDIKFQLKYHRFIQMILTEPPETTILYGRKHFSFDDPQVIKNHAILEDVFSLLAYPDPRNSPISYLFSQQFREQLANAVNGAILEFCGQPEISALEKCLTENYVLLEMMKNFNVSGALLSESLVRESLSPADTAPTAMDMS